MQLEIMILKTCIHCFRLPQAQLAPGRKLKAAVKQDQFLSAMAGCLGPISVKRGVMGLRRSRHQAENSKLQANRTIFCQERCCLQLNDHYPTIP